MENGTPIEEVEFEDEGVPPLPNQKVLIANYADLEVKNVTIFGNRIMEETGRLKYQAVLTLFMNEFGEPPVMLSFYLHELFDDAEVMARSAVMWANLMFNNVSRMVSVFDHEDPNNRIAHIDVYKLVEMEKAIEELQQIHRTDMRKIN